METLTEEQQRINSMTEQIIGSAYMVGSRLKPGYLEKVYENALVLVLRRLGHKVEQQFPVSVLFDGEEIGHYFADLFVEDLVVVEVKATTQSIEAHRAQVLNYLRCTNKKIGLLVNFGKPSVEIKRVANAF